jgi:hypothetical protein
MNTHKSPAKIFIFVFLLSFFYLMLCPLAHAFTSGIGSQACIPQKQVIKNHFKQKGYCTSHTCLAKESQGEIWLCDKDKSSLPIISYQEPTFSLVVIITSRLII